MASWLVYQPTIAPPAIPAGMFLQTLASQWQGDLKNVRRRGKQFVVQQSAFVVAIPDDIGSFETFGGRRSARPNIRAYDRSASGPIFVAAAPVAAPVVLVQDRIQRKLRKPKQSEGFSAPANIAPGQFLPSFVSQWVVQWEPRNAKQPNIEAYDRSPAGPIFIPSAAAADPIVLSQSDIRRIRASTTRRKFALDGFAAPPATAPSQFLPTFVAQWIGDLTNRRTAGIKRATIRTDIEAHLVEAPMQGEFLAAFVPGWLAHSPPPPMRKLKPVDAWSTWPFTTATNAPVYSATTSIRAYTVTVNIHEV
jgi:hypothetical protein